MFLIVTNTRDVTSDHVILELQRRQIPYLRLNTEEISTTRPRCSLWKGGVEWIIDVDARPVDLAKVSAAYFRRPGRPKPPPEMTIESDIRYCLTEWSSLLDSIYALLDGKWLNSPRAILHAENKLLQLQVAAEIGLLIPETLVTNNAGAIELFSSGRQVVGKPLRSGILEDAGQEKLIFTTRMPLLTDKDKAALEAAPIIFQSEIVKSYDIRATVVGRRVFAVRIYSQSTEETSADWRRGVGLELRHEIHRLPAEVESMCVAVVRRLDLRFGALDLILDRDDRYWFLEANPNGQWAWIETLTGLPITAAIVDELQEIARK